MPGHGWPAPEGDDVRSQRSRSGFAGRRSQHERAAGRGERINTSVAVYGGQGLGPLISESVRRSHGFGWVWAIAIALCVAATLLGTGVPVGEGHAGPAVRAPLLHPAARGPGSVLFLSLMGFGGFAAFVSLYLDGLGDQAP